MTNRLAPLALDSMWTKYAITVAGSRSARTASNQLNYPYAIEIDDDEETLFVADYDNDRIIAWEKDATNGELVAGGKGQGTRSDQLNGSAALVVDRQTGGLIISELCNRRVMRWSLDNDAHRQMLISNFRCYGLAMDDDEFLYVSDCEKHEARRYQQGEAGNTIVAHGYGAGNGINQLNGPRDVFIDKDRTVYVSDSNNHRVMKWMRNTKQGIVVAGDQDQGNDLTQLSCPRGLFVDADGFLFVVDQLNHRVVRWLKDASEGSVMLGGNGQGPRQNSLRDGPQNHQTAWSLKNFRFWI